MLMREIPPLLTLSGTCSNYALTWIGGTHLNDNYELEYRTVGSASWLKYPDFKYDKKVDTFALDDDTL